MSSPARPATASRRWASRSSASGSNRLKSGAITTGYKKLASTVKPASTSQPNSHHASVARITPYSGTASATATTNPRTNCFTWSTTNPRGVWVLSLQCLS